MGTKVKTLGIKVPADLLHEIERWRKAQDNPDLSVSDAVRALLRKALKAESSA
jgi:hypothetical protein